MKPSVGSRIISLSTLIIGALLFCLAAAALALSFRAYVDSLSRDSDTLLDETVTEIKIGNVRTAEGAARLMAPRLFNSTLLITFIDDRARVTLYQRATAVRRTPPVIAVLGREDRSGEPLAQGAVARFVLGAASIAGLQIVRANVNGIDVGVTTNEVVLTAQVAGFFPWVLVTVGVLLALTVSVGSLLNRSALRPLVDVTNALERLALGDFRPHLVESGARGQLGLLARAFNRAAARVQEAFAERDEATSSMRRFVADAGHQLRTPLTVIRGFIAVLGQARVPADSPESAHILTVMNQQVLLMGDLIGNLILLDRWEHDDRGEALPLDVRRLIEDIVARTSDANPARHIGLSARAPDEILVRADPTEFTYALTNVLDNALNYTTGMVEVAIEPQLRSVRIEVRDEGPGMPSTVAERAFDRFYRGERRDVPGSGLGLAIAKRAVERAGGDISVRSSIDRGTVVAFSLPRILTRCTELPKETDEG